LGLELFATDFLDFMPGQSVFHRLPGEMHATPADPDHRNQSPSDEAFDPAPFQFQALRQIVLREKAFIFSRSSFDHIRVFTRVHAFGNVPIRYADLSDSG
jgi:hypothetical protein